MRPARPRLRPAAALAALAALAASAAPPACAPAAPPRPAAPAAARAAAGGWVTVAYEPFDDPAVVPAGAAWRPDEVPDDGPYADGGSFFRARGVAPPRGAVRATTPFGARGWLTLESYSRSAATPLGELAAVAPDPAGGPNRALRLRSPAHTDGTIVRPSAPLPARYRVSLRVGFADFGDGRPGGANGYDGGETAEPWSPKGATDQNGFYWLAIVDAAPRPHNNVYIHHHRKIVVDTDNHHPPWMEVFDGARFVPGGDRPIMLFALDGRGRTHPRNGKPFLSWSAGRVQPSGEIRAVDRYLPGRWYSLSVERAPEGYYVELAGEFRHGGRRAYRAAFPFAEHCVWHYNRPGEPTPAACADESPAPESASGEPQWPAAGGWPDWFLFGDPHANYYEGEAYYDDVRLEVWREGGLRARRLEGARRSLTMRPGTMGEWQVEMSWVCAACAHQNRGRDLQCGRCGKAKGDEAYLMPDDVSRARAVVEADLARLAASGPNWRCRYCQSDQRRHDGSCGRCGADQSLSPGAAPAAPPPRAPRRPKAFYALLVALPVLLLVACGAIFALRSSGRRSNGLALADAAGRAEREAVLAVRSARWEHAVVVERYALRAGEGFAETRPEGAVDVRPAGARVHHYDEVPDGFRAETYTETVPDGARTETYSDRVACGEDCTTTPRVCKQKCTSNKNGFATCRDDCTGGDRRCSTRYCNQTKTRQVPQTKTVTRTRQVPQFKKVARTAPYFQWRAWGWADDRTARRAGEGPALAWPEGGELAPPAPLGRGEQERTRREATYAVTVEEGGREFTHRPATAEEFSAFAAAGRARVTLRAGEAVAFRPEP